MNRLARIWWRLLDCLKLRRGIATEVVEDVPDALKPERIYLVGEDSLPWCAALLCPCGCGETIQLSLVTKDRPSWRVKRHLSGSVTVHPSIWRTKACRSHFFVRRGRIVWALDDAVNPSPSASVVQSTRSTGRTVDQRTGVLEQGRATLR